MPGRALHRAADTGVTRAAATSSQQHMSKPLARPDMLQPTACGDRLTAWCREQEDHFCRAFRKCRAERLTPAQRALLPCTAVAYAFMLGNLWSPTSAGQRPDGQGSLVGALLGQWRMATGRARPSEPLLLAPTRNRTLSYSQSHIGATCRELRCEIEVPFARVGQPTAVPCLLDLAARECLPNAFCSACKALQTLPG